MTTICKTVSGRKVDLLTPDWREIDIEDVARGLSLINRFGGQSRRAFSVAQHSLVVAELAKPHLRLAALLHDAHEALIGDWLRPAVETMRRIGGEGAYIGLISLRRRLDIAIARRVLEDCEAVCAFGLEVEAKLLSEEMVGPSVTQADDEALRLEDAIRGAGALQNGPSPALSRAVELYGVIAPGDGVIMLEWLRAVRLAAFERYAGERP